MMRHRPHNTIDEIFLNKYDRTSVRSFRKIINEYRKYNDIIKQQLGDTEEVDVNDIYPTQPFLSQERLYKQQQLLATNNFPDYPIGIRIEEKVYLIDGHHRTAARMLRKEKLIKIRIIK